MRTFKICLLFVMIVLTSPLAQTQVSDTITMWTISTADGNEYIGVIMDEDSKTIQLKTESLGIIRIPVEQIVNRERIDQKNMVRGEFWFENPQSTRYFWGPNGYGLKEGEGYFQNIWILANQASYGFTDNFTIGMGTVPMFLFGLDAGESTPFWITPKVSIPIVEDKFNVAAGAFVGGIANQGYGGLVYGSMSYGSRDNNVSFNLGYGVLDGEWSSVPTMSLSFMRRLTKRTYFLSENYYINLGSENLVVISLGARTVWNRISLDYGIVRPIFIAETGGYLAMPWLGFSIPLGKLRRGN